MNRKRPFVSLINKIKCIAKVPEYVDLYIFTYNITFRIVLVRTYTTNDLSDKRRQLFKPPHFDSANGK